MLALDIQNLRKTYSTGMEALKGINLRVKQGEFVGLLGPNGSGKTTMIGILNSLVIKSFGQVKVFGFDLEKNAAQLKASIGTVPQEFNFSIFSKVRQIVENQAGFFGLPHYLAKERAEKCLKDAMIWDRRDDVSMSLSGGMKRRLMLARALVHEPRVLILDEPTAGVDVEVRRFLWDFLKKLNQSGVTIILTTHYLEEAEQLCDRIAILDKGRIIEDAPKKELLDKLSSHQLVLEMDHEVDLRSIDPPFYMKQLSKKSLEVRLTAAQKVSEVFAYLSSLSWVVNSIHNKANRLEELFVTLTSKQGERN